MLCATLCCTQPLILPILSSHDNSSNNSNKCLEFEKGTQKISLTIIIIKQSESSQSEFESFMEAEFERFKTIFEVFAVKYCTKILQTTTRHSRELDRF